MGDLDNSFPERNVLYLDAYNSARELMTYRIPDDGLVVDAIANVLLRNKTVVSQREMCKLVMEELNRYAEVPYKVSGERIRRISIDNNLVSLCIQYREGDSELPDVCPVCNGELQPVVNSTLYGDETIIMKKCKSCGYTANGRLSVPGKYTFNMKARRVAEIQAFKLSRMARAREHVCMACDIIESLIDGHVLAHNAKLTAQKLRELSEGDQDPGTIANMMRAISDDEGEPVWCRPLDSVKYCQRKDI